MFSSPLILIGIAVVIFIIILILRNPLKALLVFVLVLFGINIIIYAIQLLASFATYILQSLFG